MNNKKIKVLVVDDSMLFREILSRGISSDPNIEVVATATDPFDARDKILKYEPDVMTCDIEMPKMNGIKFIKRLLPQYPISVIVVSTISEAVLDAMNAGAIEFVTKPDARFPKNVEVFTYNLINKVKIAANSKVANEFIEQQGNKSEYKGINYNKIIAIGASTGGTQAISSLLTRFPSNIPSIVIVQHIPPIFSRMFAERLNNITNLTVKEATTGDVLQSGKVLIAPGDQHMKIRQSNGKYTVECFRGDKVSGHCPSVDVLFESVASEASKEAVGIILTGMGYDGAKGLLKMRKSGARTIGQDEASSVVYGMPKVAYNIGAVEKQASLYNIPHLLYSILKD